MQLNIKIEINLFFLVLEFVHISQKALVEVSRCSIKDKYICSEV